MTSCKGSLIPLPPHKDGAKLKTYQGMILRYLATLDSNKPADQSRTFIIQVHLEDDTIQVLEPPQRNSGHKGGVFLNRGKIIPHDGKLGNKLLLSHLCLKSKISKISCTNVMNM